MGACCYFFLHANLASCSNMALHLHFPADELAFWPDRSHQAARANSYLTFCFWGNRANPEGADAPVRLHDIRGRVLYMNSKAGNSLAPTGVYIRSNVLK